MGLFRVLALLTGLLFAGSAFAMRIVEAEKEAVNRKPAAQKSAAVPVTKPAPIEPEITEAKAPAKSGSGTPVSGEKSPGPFTIQVGTYQSVRRAQILRSTLENISPARIDEIEGDQGQPMYRVVVGKFPTAKEAKEFSDRHFFPKLFPRVWVHPVADPKGYVVATSEANTKLLDDPYLVQVNLHCQDGRRRGTHLTTLRPEPELRGSEVELAVNWNCYLDAPENWKKREDAIRPSHFFIAPQMGFGTLKGALDQQRSDFNYGGEVGLFRNFGAAGTGFAYRLLNRRFTASGDILDFALDHRVRGWVSMNISERLALVPEFEFQRRPLLVSNEAATGVEYAYRYLTAATLRADFQLFQIGERGRTYVSPKLQIIGGSDQDGLRIENGTAWGVELRTRSFFQEHVAGDWFVNYSSLTQNTSRGNQAETMVTIGFSVLWVD